ncbi:hypothetical protein JAAARDRAFT_49587 [Jaapia argillacea MUCL 33604]|uniref:Uncharacterized protein n=1 Tax=Jaapia argillacea MUCL 33604 TaxID=933084 RepID=A0A067PUI6_9AGAM|nr:hypothetical protein JAAARDRAFT_49587 [Jaapia argillacea MUCL 33604]
MELSQKPHTLLLGDESYEDLEATIFEEYMEWDTVLNEPMVIPVLNNTDKLIESEKIKHYQGTTYSSSTSYYQVDSQGIQLERIVKENLRPSGLSQEDKISKEVLENPFESSTLLAVYAIHASGIEDFIGSKTAIESYEEGRDDDTANKLKNKHLVETEELLVSGIKSGAFGERGVELLVSDNGVELVRL